ncbi:MAG: DUF4129 domain-containing protein [Armatimonadia bacterium]|nr:DUF4129 domain-containing protein [Armatimonadia bacterium]
MPPAAETQDNSASQAPPPPPEDDGGREPLPQFDWLTEVAIPVCVFGLLGSLLYYLIEVRSILAGQYAVGPLRWVVFWFLLATIGIARIRTKYGGAAIAGYYSALLGLAMFVFVWVYTGRAGSFYGGANSSNVLALLFNWSLVGVVWWAASAVTREATLEENVETQLEGGFWTLLADEWQYPDAEDREPDEEVDQAAARPRHPGRLVLWVSLAALILFAVGQRTIGGQGQHARVAFYCMSAYVLFALLLLALTNLSALRMQVRRRGISLAPAVTPAWIIASLIVTALIVMFSAQMPRSPTPEGHPQVVELPEWLTDSERPGMEEGPAQGLGPEGEGVQGAEQRPAAGDEDGEATGEDEEGDPGASEDAEDGDEGAGAEEGQVASSGGEDQGEGQGEGESETESTETETSPEGEEPATPEFEPPSGLARLLIMALLALAALVIAYFLWVYRKQVLAGLKQLALLPVYIGKGIARAWRKFMRWLSRLGLPVRVPVGPGELPDDPFVDIFGRGMAGGLAPAEVVRYVYRAFQVYAARGGYQRREDQTALEFLGALPERLELPDRAAERLTRAYVLATYSPREVTEAQVRGARETWTLMRERLETAGHEAGAN